MIAGGHEVSVICYEPPKVTGSTREIRCAQDEYEGIPVFRISFPKINRLQVKEYFDQELEEHLLRYFSEFKAEIVHVVHAMHLTTASIWAAKKLGIPVVATATDFWFICPTFQLLKWDESICSGPEPLTCLACVSDGPSGRWVRQLAGNKILAPIASAFLKTMGRYAFYRPEWLANLMWLGLRPRWIRKTAANIDVLIAPTPNTRRLIEIQGIKPVEMKTSGFGLESHTLVPAEGSRSAGVLRAGYIGTFRRSKGLHVVLQALRRLPSEKIELQIYGSPGNFEDYDRFIAELAMGLTNVEFRGTFPNEKLAEVLGGMDVLVIPSLWHENSPLALLSAFALKKPVLVSNIGSLADIVEHGKNGLRFEVGDDGDLAVQLNKLIEDPELIRQLRNGIPKVRTIEENIDELLDIYATVSSTSAKRIAETPALSSAVCRRWGSVEKSLRLLAFGAQFGASLALVRATVGVEPNEVTLYLEWHSPAVLPEWTVQIELVAETGAVRLQQRHRLLTYDQDPWGFFACRHTIRISEDQAGGRYRILLTVLDTKAGSRLPIVLARGTTVEEGAIVVGGFNRPASRRAGAV